MFGKKTTTLTERDVLDALKGVKDPEIGRDLVDLGMIKDVRIADGSIFLTVNLTTPACPLKAQIEKDVRDALGSRLGTEHKVQITMGAEVRGKGVIEKGDIPGVKNVIQISSGVAVIADSTWTAMQGRRALDVVTNQRSALMTLLQRRRRETAPVAARVGDPLVDRLVVDALVVRAEADLRWLDLCEERLIAVRTEQPVTATRARARQRGRS